MATKPTFVSAGPQLKPTTVKGVNSGKPSNRIGTLNESSLHAALKQLVSEPGDRFEEALDGFVIDVKRGQLLVEIQTSSFASMGKKLDTLLGEYRVELVHPIAVETYLHRPGQKPRRSPKKKSVYSVLDELVSIPTLIDHPNFVLRLALVTVDAVQVADPKARRGRGGWRVVDRRLRELRGWHEIGSAEDLVAWLPPDLEEPFGTADIAEGADFGREVAQKLAYCLRALGAIVMVDHTRAGHLYRRVGRQAAR